MADDDSTTQTPTDTTEQPDAAATEHRGGVHLPGWLAGALVVVAALAIGGVGYAIGDDGGGSPSIDPIANLRGAPSAPGTDDGGPLPPGMHDGERGGQCGPGGFGGPGGPMGPGGQLRPGGPRDERGGQDEQDEPQDDTPDRESSLSNV